MKLFKSSGIFFIITTLVILALNLTPLIIHIRHAPPGRSFAMIHNNAQDFFFYLALMNQGANGQWLTKDPYTSEPHQPSIIFSYFLWLGKLNKLLGIPHPIMYHAIRILFGFLFLLTTYNLLLITKFPHPRLTYLFFLFASPFMHKIPDGDKIISVPFMHWWTGMDAIRRAAYLPHHMIGGFLLVTTLIFLIQYVKTWEKKYIGWAILLIFPLAFIHTPSLFIILIILPPTLLIHFIRPGLAVLQGQALRKLVYIGMYWIIGIVLLYFMISQTGKGFPWSQYIEWEKRLQFPLDRELIGAFGILFPFALVGIIKAIFSRKFAYILTACWFVAPLLLIPFAKPLGISNIRLIQGTPYLPLAILAVLGIDTIKKFSIFNFQFSMNFHLLNFQIKKLIGLLGYWVIGLLFAFFTYPTLSWSLKDQIREYWPIYGNIYLDNRLNSAFSFINTTFPSKTIVLGTFYTGNYLPANTDTVSFIGHFGYTQNVKEKDKLTGDFFENKMTAEQAKKFLTENKIGLIFQGPEEKPLFPNKLYPDFLKVVYDTEEATIYQAKR